MELLGYINIKTGKIYSTTSINSVGSIYNEYGGRECIREDGRIVITSKYANESAIKLKDKEKI